VQYGPLALDVPPGDWRNLTLLEVAKLKTAASGSKAAKPPSAPTPLRAPQAPQSSKPLRSPRPSHSSSHSSKPSHAPKRKRD